MRSSLITKISSFKNRKKSLKGKLAPLRTIKLSSKMKQLSRSTIYILKMSRERIKTGLKPRMPSRWMWILKRGNGSRARYFTLRSFVPTACSAAWPNPIPPVSVWILSTARGQSRSRACAPRKARFTTRVCLQGAWRAKLQATRGCLTAEKNTLQK